MKRVVQRCSARAFSQEACGVRSFSPLQRCQSIQTGSGASSRHQLSAFPLLKATRRTYASAQAFNSSWDGEHDGLEPLPTSSKGQPDATSQREILTRFQDLADRGIVHQTIVRNITHGMKLDTMTEVQSLTLEEGLRGVDVLAQAKTGTGKTLGFLIPIIQNILNELPVLADNPLRRPRDRRPRSVPTNIKGIVISPTRELAEQIAVQARKLVEGTGIVVQTAVGGTQKSFHLRAIREQGCHLLVGTPGRLKDLLSDEFSGVDAPNLGSFVLDEADRLMDDGFWPHIQEIQSYLPQRSEKDRQTLLFSATLPDNVLQLARRTLKPNHHFVRAVQKNEQPTHERVKQYLVPVTSLENQIPAALKICEEAIAAARDRPFKAIIYVNSTVEAFVLFSIFMGIRFSTRNRETSSNPPLGSHTRVYQMHSRLSQASRTRYSEDFRNAESAILISSDVTARGMDFPNVTHIIQLGVPSDRETYIHRLGRTARAGAAGEGWIVCSRPQLDELDRRLGNLPLETHTDIEAADWNLDKSSGVSPAPDSEQARYMQLIQEAARTLPERDLTEAHRVVLHSMDYVPDRNKVIAMTNRLAEEIFGMEQAPPIPRSYYNVMARGNFGRMNRDRNRSNSSFDRRQRNDRFSSPSRQSGPYTPGMRGSSRTHKDNYQSSRNQRDSYRSFDRQSNYQSSYDQPTSRGRY